MIRPLLLLTLALALPGSAGALTWNLQGVAFDDGGTASGFFVWDTAAETATSWSLSVTGGNEAALPPFTWTDANMTFFGNEAFGGDRFLRFVANSEGETRDIRLHMPDALGTSGTLMLLTSSVDCFNCAPFRFVSSGSITTEAVPEPGAAALLLPAAAAAFLARRRTRSASPR